VVKSLAGSALIFLSAITLAASQPREPLDFAHAGEWAPSQSGSRDTNTQLMMIDVLDVEVPGLQVAQAGPFPPGTAGTPTMRDSLPMRDGVDAGPSRGVLAALWDSLTRPAHTPLARLSSGVRAVWLEPLGGARWSGPWGAGQGVTRATRVHAYLTSLGNSTGEAFDIQLVNDGTAPVRIGGDGVVVEPVKKGSDTSLRAELQQIASRGSKATSVRANAYCLEFKLKPPERGTMFRVSDQPTQQKFTAAREILRASRRLQDAGALTADSDPREYFHAIRQWAIWVNERSLTLPKYRDAFIERSKKNAEALRRSWSKALEDSLKLLVPHRWDEIAKILREARQPVPGN
jgi:hypothetical protein